MRVALLTTNMAPGGAETQVANLAMGLRRRGWSVSVISLRKPTAFAAELRAAGVPLFSSVTAIRTVRPQILHCHMFHGNVAGRLLRLVCPVGAVISTIHSAAESSRRSDRIGTRDWLYRMTDRLADVTIAVSHAVAERHVAAHAVRQARVIPNGIDTALFRPDPAERARMRQALGVGDEFLWLAVGRLMWKKDYPTLLRAFASVGSGGLLIAGAGPDEAALRASAPPSVHFLGLRNDIPALMKAADGFVLSSVVEGMPVVLLEAAAAGLPCVATDVGGVRDTGVTLALVPAGNDASLAAAMLRIMSLPADERRRITEAIRTQVCARFDTDVVIAQWEALYRELWT